MSIRHVLLAIFVTAIWGVNFVVIKVGVGEIPPLLLASIRFALTALPFVFFIPRPKCSWKLVVGFGLALGVVKFGLIFTSVSLGMPAGLTSVVLQVQAFFTVFLAIIIFKEKPKRLQLVAGSIAIAGLIIISTSRAASADLLPFLLVIMAAMAWAIANLLTSKAGKINMLSFLVWSSLVSPVPLFLLSLTFEGWGEIQAAMTGLTLTGIGAIAFLVYISTTLAFGSWSWLISRYSASIVAPFSLLVPVFGLTSAYFLIGETIAPTEAIGSVLLVLALGINILALRRRS